MVAMNTFQRLGRIAGVWLVMFAVTRGFAADSPAAAAETQLAAAVAELAALRETIATEKLPVCRVIARNILRHC